MISRPRSRLSCGGTRAGHAHARSRGKRFSWFSAWNPAPRFFFLNSDPPIGGPDSPLPASALRSARLPASRTPRQRTEHSSDLQTSLATPRAGQQTCACGEITKKRTADHDKGLAFASASTRPLAAARPRGCTDTRQEDSAATLGGGSRARGPCTYARHRWSSDPRGACTLFKPRLANGDLVCPRPLDRRQATGSRTSRTTLPARLNADARLVNANQSTLSRPLSEASPCTHPSIVPAFSLVYNVDTLKGWRGTLAPATEQSHVRRPRFLSAQTPRVIDTRPSGPRSAQSSH